MKLEARFPRRQVLLKEILRRIRFKGKITFAEFMEIALYLPNVGYYTNPDREPWKDYTTSPETHPSFGMLLADKIVEMDKGLDHPSEFTILEPGAGQGLLAIQILDRIRRVKPVLFRRLEYRILEINPHRKKVQQKNLAEYKLISKVRWVNALETPLISGCILANELLDSFPVHVVQFVDGKPYEVFVTEENGQLRTRLGGLSTTQIDEYFHQFDGWMPGKIRIEANLKAQEWISQVTKILNAGYLLIVDYGYQVSQLKQKKYSEGTIICYHNHTANSNPFLRIGYQDITSHVNFTALINQGILHGLTTREFTTQRRFLEKLGIKPIIENLSRQAKIDRRKTPELAAAKELIDPKGVGRLKVLIQSKSLKEDRIREETSEIAP